MLQCLCLTCTWMLFSWCPLEMDEPCLWAFHIMGNSYFWPSNDRFQIHTLVCSVLIFLSNKSKQTGSLNLWKALETDNQGLTSWFWEKIWRRALCRRRLPSKAFSQSQCPRRMGALMWISVSPATEEKAPLRPALCQRLESKYDFSQRQFWFLNCTCGARWSHLCINW